jgi:hypothetical protein
MDLVFICWPSVRSCIDPIGELFDNRSALSEEEWILDLQMKCKISEDITYLYLIKGNKMEVKKFMAFLFDLLWYLISTFNVFTPWCQLKSPKSPTTISNNPRRALNIILFRHKS